MTTIVEYIVEEPSSEEEYELPSYSTPGRILVDVFNILPNTPEYHYKYEFDILDYDGDSCVFWINEGEGFDYWLDEHLEITKPGVYVIEGIVGCYHRGDGWTTDDDVDWDFDSVRSATLQESMTRTLT